MADHRKSYTPSATISLTDKSADTLKRDRNNHVADVLKMWGVAAVAWGLTAGLGSLWFDLARWPAVIALSTGAILILVGETMREVEAIERALPKDH